MKVKYSSKFSFTCLPKMRSIIALHKKQLLNRLSSADTDKPLCNCRNKRDCPLKGKCIKCVIYKALICTPSDKTTAYYNCCETNCKVYYYNHEQSFKTSSKRHQAELSRLVWRHKNEGHIPVFSDLSFAKPNRTATAQCIINCAWRKNRPF